MTKGIAEIVREMRACIQAPDDKDAGSIWSWRIDEWADHLEAVQTPQEEKWEGPFANPEHDPGECGCGNHSPWCPYNPHASEINPYPLPPSGSAVQTPPTEKDPSEVKPPQGPDNWITREGVRPKV
jgi:hypothetical protein